MNSRLHLCSPEWQVVNNGIVGFVFNCGLVAASLLTPMLCKWNLKSPFIILIALNVLIIGLFLAIYVRRKIYFHALILNLTLESGDDYLASELQLQRLMHRLKFRRNACVEVFLSSPF